MRRRVVCAALLFGAASALSGCARKTVVSEVIPVMVTTVSGADENGGAGVYSGNVEPGVTVNASFTVGGYVREIMRVRGVDGSMRLLQEGDTVKKGAVLAHIRDVDYAAIVNQASAQVSARAALTEQAQSGLRQAQASLDRADAGVQQAVAAKEEAGTGYEQARAGLAAGKAQLAEAQAATQAAQALVEQAQAGHEKAESDFGRAERLYAQKSLTRSDYDAARAQLKVSEAQVKAASEQVNVAKTKIEQAKVQIDADRAKMEQTQAIIRQSDAAIKSARAMRRAAQAAIGGAKSQVDASAAGTRAAQAQLTQARTPLGDASLKAPMDGVVLKRIIEIGGLVGPGTPGFVIAAQTPVKVVVGAPDVVMKRLRIGQPVAVSTQSYEGRRFMGRITSISPAADPKSRVFRVEITVPNLDRALRIGMVAKAEIDVGEVDSALPTVPLSAVVRSPKRSDGYAVYVVEGRGDNYVARMREIEPGDTLGNSIAVRSGVRFGDRVISNGASLVRDGVRVSLVR